MGNFYTTSNEAQKILLFGEAGTGKTVSSVSAAEAGQNVRFLATERNAVSGIKKGLQLAEARLPEKEFKTVLNRVAVSVLETPKRGLSAFVKEVEKNLRTPNETQRKSVDPNKKDFTRYLNVIKGMQNFVDVDGVDHGSVESWGPDTTLFVDGNTIICEAILQQVVGGKATITQPEWGQAQGLYKQYIRALTEDFACNVVLLAHPMRVIDELTRENRIYPSSLGQALNNWLATCFGDVIWTYREKGNFYWSTDTKTVVTRASTLPIADKLPQDFKQIFKP